MLIKTLLVLVVCASPVAAQQIDRPTIFLVATGDVLALWELTGSEACIQQGTCYEKNPVVGDGTTRGATARRALLKGTGQALSTYAILRISKTSPADPHRKRKQWIAPGCGSTLFHVIVDRGLYRVGVKRTSVF